MRTRKQREQDNDPLIEAEELPLRRNKRTKQKQSEERKDSKKDKSKSNSAKNKRGRSKKEEDSGQKKKRVVEEDSPRRPIRRGKQSKKDTKKYIDESEEKPKKRGVRAKRSPSSSSEEKPKKKESPKKSEKKQASQSSPEQLKKVILKGKVPVDEHCNCQQPVHVLEFNGKIYSATLNQTNMANNNNKFYMIQVLQADKSKNYYFWTRWGRVGVRGQISLQGPYSRQVAISQYDSKFYEKHVKGQYRQLTMNYEQDKKDKGSDVKKPEKKEKAKQAPESQLQPSVKQLIEMIFDVNMMNRQMKEIGYDAKKMPLGKLSIDNIKHGYQILKDLERAIQKNDRQQIQQLNNDFFSYIPHDFGFQKMAYFMIDTPDKLKKKLQMVESLADIKVATKLMEDHDESTNFHDSNYAKLNRDIEKLDQNSREFEIIEEYLKNTHGQTHRTYTLELVKAYKLYNKAEEDRFLDHIPNKMLLWHGSRLTNYVGILSQGLRIAPPEAPVTGYMFGKGVYFADMSTKSANYCFTNRNNPEGLMLLCEVAVGSTSDKFQADYNANNLPQGKHSTKGLGKMFPPPESYIDLNGVLVPIGKPKTTTNDANYSLLYNEYIVYDIKQVKLRYLLRLRFNYK